MHGLNLGTILAFLGRMGNLEKHSGLLVTVEILIEHLLLDISQKFHHLMVPCLVLILSMKGCDT